MKVNSQIFTSSIKCASNVEQMIFHYSSLIPTIPFNKWADLDRIVKLVKMKKLSNIYQPIPSGSFREFIFRHFPREAWNLPTLVEARTGPQNDGMVQLNSDRKILVRKVWRPKITTVDVAHKFHHFDTSNSSNSLKQSAICDTNSYETERDCAGNGLAKHWWPGKILHHKCAASRLLVGFPEVFQTEYQFLWKLHTCWQKVSLSLSVKWGWVWPENARQAEMLSALDYYNAGFISEANSCELWMFDMFETPPYT